MSAKLFKLGRLFLSITIFVLIVFLVLFPQTYMQSTINGIDVWLTKVVPALFPFFFLTKLLTEMNVVEKISKIFKPITNHLFKAPGISSYAFLMSIISGYPVGAKIISELFKKGIINNSDAVKMNSFCSTSGPLFVIGTVGAGLFNSQKFGLIILLSHILGAFFNGILYRNYKGNQNCLKKASLTNIKQDNILSSILYDSIISILMVGGFIAIFFVFIDFLNNIKMLSSISAIFANIFSFTHLDSNFFNCVLNGLLEVTRGLLDLSQTQISPTLLCSMATFLISFGGLSIHLQSIIFLKEAKIKMSNYFLQKITHSILSTIICVVCCFILL